MTIGTGPAVDVPTITDRGVLTAGYLTAVANRLMERGIFVRSMQVDEPADSDGCALGGVLNLDPMAGPRSPWAPARLRWQHAQGWSAYLEHRTDPGLGAVPRYLTGHLVPCPEAVAQFVVALNEDPGTVWASASFRPMETLDFRYLELELRGFLPATRRPVLPGPRFHS